MAKRQGLSDLSLKDSGELPGRWGVDYLINRDWLVNMSVWYMDIDTTAKYKSDGRKLAKGSYSDNVRLDPWVFMFSAGYRFLIFSAKPLQNSSAKLVIK